MQGTCAFDPPQGSKWIEQRQEFLIPVTVLGGRTFADFANKGDGAETGLTRPSAEKIYEAQVAAGKARSRSVKGQQVYAPFFPPNAQCTAYYLDQAAGRPFKATLWMYVPEPDSAMFKRSWVKPSSKGSFRTGCREEKRNGLSWTVCLGAGEERAGGPGEMKEAQWERWVAPLGDSGFYMHIWVSYREPLFLWPQWYAERQAGLLEVIDSVRVETLPLAESDLPADLPGLRQ